MITNFQSKNKKNVIGRLVAGAFALALTAGTVFGSPVNAAASGEAAFTCAQEDWILTTASAGTTADSTEQKTVISAKALKKAKADITVKVNGKTLSVKGFQVSAKVNGKKQTLVYVPVKKFAAALGGKFSMNKNGEAIISTGEMAAHFEKGQDGYAFITEIEGAVGATASLSYGKAYTKNRVLYIPATVFETLYGNILGGDISMKLNKKNFTFTYTAASEAAAQVPNPVHEQPDIQSLSKAVGFEVILPSALAADPAEYSDISGELAQAIFQHTGNPVYYRMSKGTEDISGVYLTYENVSKKTIAGNASSVSLAVWNDGTYSYSVYAEAGITEEEMIAIVESVK